MNVLLTGGTGYIASHAAVVLIEAGFNVVLLDNLSNSQRDVVDRLEKITLRKIKFVEGDVRDKHLISLVLKEYKIDAVMHFAGLKAVGESVVDPLRYFDNNVGGATKLFEAMRECEVKKIVFSSSATVYGEPRYLPFDESHPTEAINPYGRTKLYIEEMLCDLANADQSWSAICLRYFNPVGGHESGLLGENSQGTPNNLMPYIVRVASGKLGELSIFGSDYPTRDGTGERDYVHVVDLAEGHLAALKYLFSCNGWSAINIGTQKSTTVLELIDAFERTNKIRIPFKFSPRRPGDLPAYFADASKARKVLGWEAKRDIDNMCLTAWNSETRNVSNA